MLLEFVVLLTLLIVLVDIRGEHQMSRKRTAFLLKRYSQ